MKKQLPEIIYEDETLLIVHKPPDFLSIPERFDLSKPSVVSFLRQKFEDVRIVHRLDRETSGIMCFARTEAAHRHLSRQFEQRTTTKIYLALVDGRMYEPEGAIDQSIGPHPGIGGKMMVTSLGKPSLTLYKAVELFQQFTLVEADLKTGRSKQVRVHLAYIGHPLAVDPMYGRREVLSLSEIKRKGFQLGKFQEERPLMSRTTLHAHRLEIDHPETGVRLSFSAPLPKDFEALLTQLRKWGK